MSERIISIINLEKKFQTPEKLPGFWAGLKSLFKPVYKEVTAVDKISLSVNSGEFVAFIGPNGAGKSTVTKIMTGILYPSNGTVSVLGMDPFNQRKKLAYSIGTVFGQKSQLWFHLPPQDTYNLLAKIYDIEKTKFKERVNFLIQSFQIENLLRTPVRKLSLGERMKCELVASLLHSPKILFLDEPTIGLDVVAKQQVRDLLRYLNEKEKVTIFLTSHDVGDIEILTERTIIINYGRIIYDGTTENLKKNFITSKVITLAFEEDAQQFKYEGGKILQQEKHSLTIEIDPKPSSMEKLLSYALENFTVLDIQISDTPLEEVITKLYRG